MIIPRVIRGRLYFQICDVLFPTFRQAASAWFAADAHRLDIVEGGYIMTPSTTTLLLQLALLLEDAVPDLEQSRQLVGAVLDRCSVLDAIGRDMGRRERTHQEHRADASV